MPTKRLSMRKIRELLRLRWGRGLSQRDVAKGVGVSSSTVADCVVRAKEAGLGWPLPEDLEALLLRCLEKKAADRPQSAAELSAALEACTGVGNWTESDARRWWQEHDDALQAKRARDAGTSTTRTIAVALAR